MAETKNSSAGTKRSSASGSIVRLVVAIVAMLATVALVLAIRSLTWDRVVQLEREFAAVESEQFLLGIHAREAVAQMNAELLRYKLSGDVDAREMFLSTGGRISERLSRTMPLLATVPEREAAKAFKNHYATYREQMAAILEEKKRNVRKDTAEQVYDAIQEKSRAVQEAASSLAAAQANAWADFVAQSRGAMTSLRNMLWLSFLTLLGFACLLSVLLHRSFIAPLQSRLDRSEQVIARHEKMASLGTLAAGVAHEIRNPLQAIKMRLFSLKKTLGGTLQDDEDLAVISSEINRLEKIVKETLDFARPPSPEFSEVSASDVVSGAVTLLRRVAPDAIALNIETGEVPIRFRGDQQQIRQVLINLVQNAIDSMDGKGTVTVRVRAGSGRVNGERLPVVLIEVSDTGRGIPPDAEQRVFDPFYSTKEAGTGLGLSIAARIVEAHGGTIQFSTEQGQGTTFTIMLPRLTDERTNSAN